ncbi:hypothetical protein Dimus_005060 [Dionaea muscipula]
MEEGTVGLTKRRHLRKATSVIVVAAADSEETESDKDVRKLASDSNVNEEKQTKKRNQKSTRRRARLTKRLGQTVA